MTMYTPNSGVNSLACYGPMPNDPAPCQMGGYVYVMARSRHPTGVMTVFGDGSTRFIANSIGINAWRALSSANGGEVIDGRQY